VPVTISSGASGFVAVEGPASPARVGNGNGTSPSEHFVLAAPGGRPGPLMPGEPALVRSVATGMYCRMVAQPGGAEAILCDAAVGTELFFFSSAGIGSGTGVLAPAGPDSVLLLDPGGPVAPGAPVWQVLPVGQPLPPPRSRQPPPPPRPRRPPPPRSRQPPPCADDNSRGQVPPRGSPRQALRRPPPDSARLVGLSKAPAAARPQPGSSRVVRTTSAPLGSRAGRQAPLPPPLAPGCQGVHQPPGSPCGGIVLCGIDAACPSACCVAGSSCTRQSAYTWVCQQQQQTRI
jgi:hypothetical protein